ncbi:MAG: hypothetical protein IT233_02525 [Bacteroidia bacterium]|nr:hypothetical protein [Bacteroidia bacterium]
MNSLIIKLLVLIICLLGYSHAAAQFFAPYLSNRVEWQPGDTQRVQLTLHMNNYLKNNEYFGPIYHGYTLFGTHMRSALAFSPREFVRLEGGIFLLNDFGSDQFSSVRPFFSIKLRRKSHEFLFGNLDGAAQHRMIEPLWDAERSMTHPFEQGMQYKSDSRFIKADLWIDWVTREDAIRNIQEKIESGLSLEFIPVKKPQYSLSVPLQGVVWHLGGQLNEALYPVETILNAAGGLRWEFRPEKKWCKYLFAETFALLYGHSNNTFVRRYSKGYGYYSGLAWESAPGFFATAHYFFGYHYISGTGNPLFQSVSYHYPSYYENYRELLTMRIGYRKEVFPGMWADVRLEPYYDIGGNFWEFSYGGFLTYKHTFTLKKKI